MNIHTWDPWDREIEDLLPPLPEESQNGPGYDSISAAQTNTVAARRFAIILGLGAVGTALAVAKCITFIGIPTGIVLLITSIALAAYGHTRFTVARNYENACIQEIEPWITLKQRLKKVFYHSSYVEKLPIVTVEEEDFKGTLVYSLGLVKPCVINHFGKLLNV